MNRPWGAKAQLALDAIHRKPTKGIPSWTFHPMEHKCIDVFAGAEPGSYVRQPEATYLTMQHRVGTCMIDQYIPTNPLSMGGHGFEENTERGATTGAENICLNGILIDSPEAVVEHLETFAIPWMRAELQKNFSQEAEDANVKAIIENEVTCQDEFGADLLKVPYGVVRFPILRYFEYGYIPYFMAYALYPEVIEQDFALQAELAVRNNRGVARAYQEGDLPPLIRLDHDMADSRGTLVNIRSLDRMWFPAFARSLEPIQQAGIQMIWHCDGNLMQMVPRLLEVGLHGFQGFQYEDGMDYEAICQMKTREGDDLLIIAGVSVTRTLPMGTPGDIKREMQWLVEHGPKTGLFLGGSSSIAPGVPFENLQTFAEGLQYYQTHGR